NASVITDNPVGLEAVATLPDELFFTAGTLDGNVKGSISVKSSANGIGVEYKVSFSNLPKDGGPFLYHIHEKKVPNDGNCTSTAAHLDPFVRGEMPTCESKFPQTCQVGDLSGKYGKITSDPFEATYHDEFSSLIAGNNASIVDRSFVVHFSNKTRISCANFA
ncbi:superoxide dismutase, partial [Pseudomassariella vexata]